MRRLGLDFDSQAADLPGTPDFAIRGRMIAVFVNGCFWHRHRACGTAQRFSRGYWRRRNREYWRRKLAANVRRDRRARRELRAMGWRPVTIWECRTSDARILRRALSWRLRPVRTLIFLLVKYAAMMAAIWWVARWARGIFI